MRQELSLLRSVVGLLLQPTWGRAETAWARVVARRGPAGAARGAGGAGTRGAVGLEEPGGMGEQGAGTLTARMVLDDEFPHFVVDEDEKAVGSRAEPPQHPVGHKLVSVGRTRAGGGTMWKVDPQHRGGQSLGGREHATSEVQPSACVPS